jgi:hypothetical protein
MISSLHLPLTTILHISCYFTAEQKPLRPPRTMLTRDDQWQQQIFSKHFNTFQTVASKFKREWVKLDYLYNCANILKYHIE